MRGATRSISTSTSTRLLFQPTRSLRGATSTGAEVPKPILISTHALLAGRDQNKAKRHHQKQISTHALLAGRDSQQAKAEDRQGHFNPRAPCGARLQTLHPLTTGSKFQPTRSLRGATIQVKKIIIIPINFNPRAPCGARLCSPACAASRRRISTHALLAGRDKEANMAEFIKVFQPTRSLRGATEWRGQ